jgi:hypothetical protein
VELEVFVQNERAVRLYAGRGFARRCELFGWDLAADAARPAAGPATEAVREAPLDDAFAWLDAASARIDDLPLQVTTRVLATHRAHLVAWRHGHAQLVFAPGTGPDLPVVVHSLVDVDVTQRDADVLVAALLARFPGRAIKVPAIHRPDVGAAAFDRAGLVRQALHQQLMRLDLA